MTDSSGSDPARSGTGIVVAGQGRASVVPDFFVLSVGTEAASSRAGEATSRAGAALDRIRAAALARGVAAEDLTTRAISLRQGYDREGRPAGVVCELGLDIRAGDVARAGELASACVEAGGEEARLQGVSFRHSDPAATAALARAAAFADAEARARHYAALAGRELGPVREVSESVPGYENADHAVLIRKAVPADLPVSAGTLDVAVAVTVRWAWA